MYRVLFVRGMDFMKFQETYTYTLLLEKLAIFTGLSHDRIIDIDALVDITGILGQSKYINSFLVILEDL